MDVPCHDAERRVHTGAVGVEGVELEMVVAEQGGYHQKEENSKRDFSGKMIADIHSKEGVSMAFR